MPRGNRDQRLRERWQRKQDTKENPPAKIRRDTESSLRWFSEVTSVPPPAPPAKPEKKVHFVQTGSFVGFHIIDNDPEFDQLIQSEKIKRLQNERDIFRQSMEFHNKNAEEERTSRRAFTEECNRITAQFVAEIRELKNQLKCKQTEVDLYQQVIEDQIGVRAMIEAEQNLEERYG